MGSRFNANGKAKTKAYIVNNDTNKKFTFQFNPTTMSLDYMFYNRKSKTSTTYVFISASLSNIKSIKNFILIILGRIHAARHNCAQR